MRDKKSSLTISMSINSSNYSAKKISKILALEPRRGEVKGKTMIDGPNRSKRPSSLHLFEYVFPRSDEKLTYEICPMRKRGQLYDLVNFLQSKKKELKELSAHCTIHVTFNQTIDEIASFRIDHDLCKRMSGLPVTYHFITWENLQQARRSS